MHKVINDSLFVMQCDIRNQGLLVFKCWTSIVTTMLMHIPSRRFILCSQRSMAVLFAHYFAMKRNSDILVETHRNIRNAGKGYFVAKRNIPLAEHKLAGSYKPRVRIPFDDKSHHCLNFKP